ncbi:MAG TPA: phospholipase D-like domain-containing protein [Arachnia sp.]|nr:phospholipase D-like domain-containing protein [Arachnia sp.]HQD22475.1 phospholipase D-like domain-containing protein [Arachnia sp.]
MTSAAWALGNLLSAAEAERILSRFRAGLSLTQALQGLDASRASQVRGLLEAVGATPARLEVAGPLLEGIAGARSAAVDVAAVWTLPGGLAKTSSLTSSVPQFVESARSVVVCSTFNFTANSALRQALVTVASRGVDVSVYVDGEVNSGLAGLAASLDPARLYASRQGSNGVRNHAKFIAVDHQFVWVTSANFSWSAENTNVELGLRVQSRSLTEAIEGQLEAAKALYVKVTPA